MRLKVLLPSEILVDEDVTKVVADAQNGSFCLLPRHVDFAAPLASGILSYENGEGEEIFLAVDGGILVKCGADVLVSTPRAVRGPGLADLRRVVEESFRQREERDRRAREALDRMEAEFISRIGELEGHGRR